MWHCRIYWNGKRSRAGEGVAAIGHRGPDGSGHVLWPMAKSGSDIRDCQLSI